MAEDEVDDPIPSIHFNEHGFLGLGMDLTHGRRFGSSPYFQIIPCFSLGIYSVQTSVDFAFTYLVRVLTSIFCVSVFHRSLPPSCPRALHTRHQVRSRQGIIHTPIMPGSTENKRRASLR
jgi:hypothetical protein